jgi:hypothetical protein
VSNAKMRMLLLGVADLEARPGSTGISPTAWCRRDLDPHARDELVDQLDAWTAWLRHRYPLARKIPDCWSLHPELIEELSAPCLAWQGAYQQPNAPLAAAPTGMTAGSPESWTGLSSPACG